MEKTIKRAIKELQRNINNMKLANDKRRGELAEYESFKLKSKAQDNAGLYYYVKKGKGKPYRYVGKEDNTIIGLIKETRYRKELAQMLESNAKAADAFLKSLVPVDYEHVNASLPAVYRGAALKAAVPAELKAAAWKRRAAELKLRHPVMYPEKRIHETEDGSFVRSKSEKSIYNCLLSEGVTFEYELPLELDGTWVFPDFTILCETDWESVIIIEHAGMMSMDGYRNAHFNKFMRYWNAGYTQGVNIFYTFDDVRGTLDLKIIREIVRCRVRPEP